MESNKIKNDTKKIKIFILIIVLLTLGFLLPYYGSLAIIMFFFFNIYTLVKQSLYVLDNEHLIRKLLEKDGVNTVSKIIYKYNFITRFFFKFILRKIQRDFSKLDQKIKEEKEKFSENFSKSREEFRQKFNQDTNFMDSEISECLKVFGLKINELNLEIVKSKYKNLAKLYHPDINPGNDDTQIKKINSCKDRLVRFIKNKGF